MPCLLAICGHVMSHLGLEYNVSHCLIGDGLWLSMYVCINMLTSIV